MRSPTTSSLFTHRRDLWALAGDLTYLNHGSYGAATKVVIEEQKKYIELLESAPTVFVRVHLPKLLRIAREALAKFVNGPEENLAFAKSATEATNAVLRSLNFEAGDEIIVTNHGYGAVWQTLCFLRDTQNIVPVVAEVPYPLLNMTDVSAAIEKSLTPRTKLVIIDHITSPSAIIFPIEEVISQCKRHGVAIFVDGAHAPGHVPIDLRRLQPDFYVGNFHKWMCAPKGSAFLYVSNQWRETVHPLSISHHYKKGLTPEFDWPGTNDPTAWLCLPTCIAWFDELGRFTDLVARNRSLAYEAARLLNEQCGFLWGHAPDPTVMGCMAALRVPYFQPGPKSHLKLIDSLYEEFKIDIQATIFANQLIVRISAQAYNCWDEYVRLAQVLGKFDFSKLI